jgi:hypothetical protein
MITQNGIDGATLVMFIVALTVGATMIWNVYRHPK